MATTFIPRTSVMFPEVFRWLDSLAPATGQTPVRVEDYLDRGNYVLRAELPGMNPKDIHVSVQGNVLNIAGERTETKRDNCRSEFHYGSFSRSVALPEGADAQQVEARYDAGVLQVTVPVREENQNSREIAITTGQDK